MAMRAPDAGAQHLPIPDDDPLLVAMRNAPVVDGEPSEEELAAMREWEEQGRPLIPHAVVVAELEERARREG